MKNNKLLNVGIIGCGLIGEKRANAIGQNGRLVACADLDIARARKLARKYTAKAYQDWQDLIQMPCIDVVIVSTLHDSLSGISHAAIQAGKHVLVEKPAARNTMELQPVITAAASHGVKVHVGFNHRYHRSLRKAKQLVNSGALGDLMFIRARYGHGGRIGYASEWRADSSLSGGGELIDQGPHLIDLSRWFLGDLTQVQGFTHTYFWDMQVEDNGFMLLKTPNNKVAFLHVSCTEWKNLFSMEIYGRLGKLDLSGLGGSYGTEKLTWYRMLPELGPPETTSWEYPMADDSWEVEMAEFFEDITLDRETSSSLYDAHAALKIIETIYRESGHDYSS